MNELQISCDLLVTDYSSCMFDAILAGKKVIRYASDIESYNAERGSYFSDEETPFPLAQNEDELCSIIRDYNDGKERALQENFLNNVGSVERGIGAQNTADLILNHINVPNGS